MIEWILELCLILPDEITHAKYGPCKELRFLET